MALELGLQFRGVPKDWVVWPEVGPGSLHGFRIRFTGQE
jgi:hypothetical protein